MVVVVVGGGGGGGEIFSVIDKHANILVEALLLNYAIYANTRSDNCCAANYRNGASIIISI